MQIKKDEVRQQLLDAAAGQFLLNGYEQASIRGIVNDAGTTIGNFYNYFESKEAIFSALTEDVYQLFAGLMDHHSMDNRDELLESRDIDVWRQSVLDLMYPLLSRLDETFLLLMENENTRYGDLKQRLLDLLSEHFHHHLAEFAPEYRYPQLGRIAANGLLTGICETIRIEKNPDTRISLITELILFFAVGIVEFYGGKNDDQRQEP